MKRIIFILTLWFVTILRPASAVDFVVIVNRDSGIDKLTKEQVVNLYMGRFRKLPSGITALPIDLSNSISERAQFYSLLVGKDLSEINSYWARLTFSGQGSPPKQVDSMDDVINIVSDSRGAVGYIDKKKLNDRVKAVYEIVP